MSFSESIINFFWNFFPWSVGLLVIPIVIYYSFRGKKEQEIENRVHVFFRGNTDSYYPCTIEKNACTFSIDEDEYTEPLLGKTPRISREKGVIYRTFMYAQGVGFVDIPPLSIEDREKIIGLLVENDMLKEEHKTDADKMSDELLMEYVSFYNFDITHETDNPMNRNFIVGMNALENFIGGLMRNLQTLEPSSFSNIKILGIYVAGALTGFGLAWALTLKGAI